MSLRLVVVVVVTVIAVVSTITVIVTTPEMMAARRVHQRFAAEALTRSDSLFVRAARGSIPRLSTLGIFEPFRRGAEQRGKRRLEMRLPDSLDRVVRQLRAGATLSLALRGVGTDDMVFARVAAELDKGQSLQKAVAEWGAEDELPNRKLTATALELASSSGGATARVLDGVAASLRDRVALEREVAALSSQSRASAVVLVVAPVVFAAAMAMVDHRILDVLIGRPIGWACVGLGLGLDALGAFWMSRLIGRHR
jgi:tight adherence protein B